METHRPTDRDEEPVMDEAAWIWAAVAIGSGLLFGEIAGRIVRLALARGDEGRSREHLGAQIGSLVFWVSTSIGLVLAIAIVDTTVLEELWQRLADSLPRLMVGFLLLIAGWVVSLAVAAMVGQSLRKASGFRQVALERLIRAVIMAATIVVALTEVGVDPSVLVVLLAIALGAPALTIGVLTAQGGRSVARQIAAGRAIRTRLHEGQELHVGDEQGTVVGLHPTMVELQRPDGTHVQVPNTTLLESGYRSGW